jgi:hypothetical protein
MGSQRTNVNLPAVSRTTNVTGTAVNARGATNVSVDINISAFTGTSITFTIQALDPATNTWFTLLASAAQTGVARLRLNIGPSMPTTANLSVTTVVPPSLRVTTSGTWNPATFSVVFTLQG